MNPDGAYDWVLLGFGAVLGTTAGYWLWVRFSDWRQDRRSRRRRQREFL